jgi:hypothetical protein
MGLLLEAVDADGPWRWRWLLSDEETGDPLADHLVRLDPESMEVRRFTDLYDYVENYTAPGRRARDGARFVTAAGTWAGRDLLGEAIGSAIAAESPVTVRVKVPASLDAVLLWPLELAHADGRPLAARGDVTLVYDIAPDAPPLRKAETGETLRVLAVFSQPTGSSLLALRRERYALAQLIRRLRRERAMVTLRVVQYSATRKRLAEIAEDGDGWDVLHLSGHGAGGAFLLEKADGSPDLVPTDDLVALLRPVRRRVKLTVLSACESAANATAETYRLLGLTDQAEQLEAATAAASATGQPAAQVGLARALVRALGCAVVGMRYLVDDDFAIAFGDVLYEQLLSHRQPVDTAVARAVAAAAGPTSSMALPAVSLATPGVFGSAAIGLRLTVPRGQPRIDPANQRMAYFPDEPVRFVGRAEAMARASSALAPSSGKTGVLLHGMAGAGKTACALELAYRHQDAFAALAFWQAPTRRDEWASALPDLAGRLDIQLADYGFTMTSHIGTVKDLDAFLPRLRAVMAETGVLLVLDNMETLLTPEGAWRDSRWDKLITALATHNGESRVILTGRTMLAGLAASPVVTLPMHSLSLQESVVLARELPNLRTLLHTDVGPLRTTDAATDTDATADAETEAAAEADRDRVLRVLRVVQGHPKLMELADAAAADRDRLDAQLAAGEAAGSGLDAFFRAGTSTLEPEQFLDALTMWTVGALGSLPTEARLMAEFLAFLEDSDRISYVIDAVWANLWRRLDQPDDAPAPGPLLNVLAGAALIEADLVLVPDAPNQPGQQIVEGDQSSVESGADLYAYRMHPVVAAAITGVAGPGPREAADYELAAYWSTVFDWARTRRGGEDSGLVVQAGFAAAPYLLRREDWNTAGFLLEQATARDRSPGTVQAALPSLRRIADATDTPANVGRLARVLSEVDPGEAERMLRSAAAAAADAGDFQSAAAASGDLANLHRDAGRLAEALEHAGQKAEYTRRAGLGPWTQLGDQAWRLQVLGQMGEHAQVLEKTDLLRAAMGALPARRDPGETMEPWNVRELILDTGHTSALATGDWTRCLELNAESTVSKRERGAGAHEDASSRFNDAVPLIELGRLAEAGHLLAECQRVFKDSADITRLALVLSARAILEAKLGHMPEAADLGRAALRLLYARPDPRNIAAGHHNLADYQGSLGDSQAELRAHRLAAALVYRLAGMAYQLADTMRSLAAELRADGSDTDLPSTVAGVIAIAELTEGVRLGSLLTTMQPDPRAIEDVLAEILGAAAALPPTEVGSDITRYLKGWEPVIGAIAAACQLGQGATPDLLQFLDERAATPDWAALGAVLHRILAGERDESLLDGLDPIDTAIARETLSRLA